MSATKLIKENLQEVIDVSATLMHKEGREGGFGSGLCILTALSCQ